MRLREAFPEDVGRLTAIINAAYRVEDFFKIGDRIEEKGVIAQMEDGKFLVLEDDYAIAGCVCVEVKGDLGYFGLLAVDPPYQGRRLGTQLLEAAEEFCRGAGCRSMEILVVNLRSELLPYYRRHGYTEVGVRPFTLDEPTKRPCHFVVLRKSLAQVR